MVISKHSKSFQIILLYLICLSNWPPIACIEAPHLIDFIASFESIRSRILCEQRCLHCESSRGPPKGLRRSLNVSWLWTPELECILEVWKSTLKIPNSFKLRPQVVGPQTGHSSARQCSLLGHSKFLVDCFQSLSETAFSPKESLNLKLAI